MHRTAVVSWEPDRVVAPGDILAEELDERRIPWSVFSRVTGIDMLTLLGITLGRTEITDDLAVKLAEGTGVSAAFWLGVERSYRDGLAKGKTRL